ncbi:uridine kinase [uncultured Jatrophihabitans sp.]|uniref:uridine kinase n=1 Tax=uncultured Jatrophihabitans sp. TaxID=1610747 RepID=UPI0035CC5994
MTRRTELVSELAAQLAAVEVGHPVRVGVDGPCGSGKSTLAGELVAAITRRGRPAVHIDSDGFHHPRDVRYRQGRDSARGYYEDAYDFDALVERVLLPLGPDGTRIYAPKVHDLATDRVEEKLVAVAPEDAIVVFDCTFLQRGLLRDHWDEVIYLQVRRDVAVARGAARDAAAFGGIDGARNAYEDRYMAAYDIYVREELPAERAGVVIDLDDIDRPHAVGGLECVR